MLQMTDNLFDLKMNIDSIANFDWSDIKEVADCALFKTTGKYLSDIEVKVLQASWMQKTYEEMAVSYGYSTEYLNKDVGNKLWHKLSTALGEKVTKKNFKSALKRVWEKQNNSIASEVREELQVKTQVKQIPFPESSIAPNSDFYIERNNVEHLCYETITKPGSLIRIKAPKLMGKTSLTNRIIANAKNKNYQTVYLDLSSVERRILTDLEKFLRWFCCMASRQLKLENQLNDYWDSEILGSNDNCTVYFEEYLLTEIDSPIVLALDNVDKIFAYTEVIEDFFGMLRSWHEKAKISEIWQKLRLVIAHSQEVYVPLNVNQSPFNVGLSIDIGEFNTAQIKELIQRHGLNWSEVEIGQLKGMIDGHPYLLRTALYQIAKGDLTLEQFLKIAPTDEGLFGDFLYHYLLVLEED